MLSAPAGLSSLVPDYPSPSDDTIEGVAPEPDSTEDSFGTQPENGSGRTCRSTTSPVRRCSHPVTGSPRDAVDAATRRSSEGSNHVPVLGEDGGGGSALARVRGPGADWSATASSVSHIFVSSSSGDSCYLGEDCRNSGSRAKCVACRIICHESCMASLNAFFPCRQSFRESIRKYREQTSVDHHWVQRKNLKGKCKHCGKTFQSKLIGHASVVGLSCSWCKYSYHYKDSCLKALEEDLCCDLGVHSRVIVPPSWIVKVPRKGSFKSSLKTSPNKKKKKGLNNNNNINNNKSVDKIDEAVVEEQVSPPTPAPVVDKEKPFCLKPIPSPNLSPILVFLNPKSGGNQGAKLMQKFQWLLNPRQVFDLTEGGPQPAIELFKKVPNVRLLACGGDGTVGWLLSVLDKVPVDPPPPVGVLPLGTGNDLSRSLGWGGGYIDEPISKILSDLQSAETLQMDRWALKVVRNSECPSTDNRGEDKLPLNVVNNYFSFGVDAQIALQFHEAREANPQKFNSRIRNKMFYGQAGGKDLLLRKWKDLSDYVTVECDGKDITAKLKEHRVHSVLFANIPSFGSGTHPWNRASGEQRIDDGLIEVIGLTTYQLPLLQAGGHGTCITQCRSARIITRKTIPMQVDGEASRLNPAIIELNFLNQVSMLAKRKKPIKSKSVNGAEVSGSVGDDEEDGGSLKLRVSRIKMADYETYHHQKDRLKESAMPYGEIMTVTTADLEQIRSLIDKVQENNQCPDENSLGGDEASAIATTSTAAASIGAAALVPALTPSSPSNSSNWCFLDSVTAMRFFRIDRAQEHLHFVLDICDESGLYILDEEDQEGVDGDEVESEILSKVLESLPPDLGTPRPDDRRFNGRDAENPEASPPSSPSKMSNVVKAKSSTTLNVDVTREVSQHRPLSPRPQLSPSSSAPQPSPRVLQMLEKTTEGILKAARLGDIRMLSELHREGYSLLSIDETGKTALHYGARFGHKEVVKFLIANAPICILDMVDNEKGQTALHKAANYKRRTICCMLIAAGASLLVQDHAGLTPRQLAVMAEDHDLSDYLESQEKFQAEKLEAGGDLIDKYETPV